MREARNAVARSRCSCEYPCSCVVFRGKRYPDRDAVIEELAQTLDRVADKLDEVIREELK